MSHIHSMPARELVIGTRISSVSAGGFTAVFPGFEVIDRIGTGAARDALEAPITISCESSLLLQLAPTTEVSVAVEGPWKACLDCQVGDSQPVIA